MTDPALIPVDDLTRDQLKTLAEVLELDIAGNAKNDDFRTAVLEAAELDLDAVVLAIADLKPATSPVTDTDEETRAVQYIGALDRVRVGRLLAHRDGDPIDLPAQQAAQLVERGDFAYA